MTLFAMGLQLWALEEIFFKTSIKHPTFLVVTRKVVTTNSSVIVPVVDIIVLYIWKS